MRYTRHHQRGGLVYVIGHEMGFEKIGCATDADDRRDSLQTGSPYWLTVKTTIDVVGDNMAVESVLHEYYDEFRVRGEWFELPHEEITALTHIDTLYETTIEQVDGWTPQRHLELSDSELEELRMDGVNSRAMDSIEEVCELIESGDFPAENLHSDNAAIEDRAESVGLKPRLFVEKVESKL